MLLVSVSVILPSDVVNVRYPDGFKYKEAIEERRRNTFEVK